MRRGYKTEGVVTFFVALVSTGLYMPGRYVCSIGLAFSQRDKKKEGPMWVAH